MNSLKLKNTTFKIKINRKLINSLRLRLASRRTLIVSAPPLIPESFIQKFILENQEWILHQSVKQPKNTSLLKLKSISILGEKYDVVIKKTSSDSLIIFDDQKTIHLNTRRLTRAHLKTIISQRLKPLAVKLIKTEIALLQSQYHFSYKKLTFRNQRSRFGSCSTSGTLSFNWQIIFFPQDKFRHILLHEIAHITHHNHSKNFWNLLAVYDPDWRQNRLWVKKEGRKHFLVSI